MGNEWNWTIGIPIFVIVVVFYIFKLINKDRKNAPREE